MTKSPFLIFRRLLSPSLCEQIVDCLDYPVCDTPDNSLSHQITHSELCQQIIINQITNNDIIDKIESHYTGFDFKGSTKFDFVRLLTNSTGIPPHGENCAFINGKWAQVKPYDLTCHIALNDSNTQAPFDDDYEVYGGKYQFVSHKFGFLPERGTLIVHPSSPHFVNAHGEVKRGSLTFVKFHLVSHNHLIYQPSDYPGNFTTWFTGVDTDV